MQKRGRGADTTTGLNRPDRRRRYLERDSGIGDPRFHRFAGEISVGGAQPTGRAFFRQRPLVYEQRIQRGADAADIVSGGGVLECRREGQRDIAVDAHPHPPGMIDAQCDAGAVCVVGRGGQRLDGPCASDRRRGGGRHLFQ